MISPLKRKARRPPFVFAFKAIMRDARLSYGARVLIHVIKSYSDSSGLHCYPGQDTLARDMGCSVPTVKRFVAELRRAGLLSTDQRRNKDGKTSTTAYLLDDERRAKLTLPRRKKVVQPGITADPPSVSGMIPGEAQKVVPFTEETKCRL